MEGTDASDEQDGLAANKAAERQSPPSSTNFWLITSFIVMMLSLIWCFHALRQGKVSPSKPIPIVSAPSVSRDVPIYLSALGNVIPTYNIQVRAQVSGILEQVFFKEGQLVKKGEVLAQIDPRPFEALLTQYEGNLKRDSALLANARIDLKRYQKLWREDSISQQTLATQQSLVEQYEGAVKIDQGLIESTTLNLNYCQIKSPVNGRIGLRLVDPGNFVQLSDASGIAVVNTINPITVLFALAEDTIPQLISQVYAHKKLKVYAYDRQQNELLAAGILLSLDNQIDPTTGTVKLKAAFTNKNNALFPNQFVNVKILVATLNKAILVPTSAIQHTLQGDFVYILDKQHVAIKHVVTGPSVGEETVIKSGLSSGELVVIEGADKLIHGAHVIDEQASLPATSLQSAFNTLYAHYVS